MSMTREQFQEITIAFAKANGLTVDEAGELVAQIGDTPTASEDGQKVIVNGKAYFWFDEEIPERSDPAE